MQEDIDLFILLASSRIKAFPPIGKRNSVQWWGGWVSTCLCVCESCTTYELYLCLELSLL